VDRIFSRCGVLSAFRRLLAIGGRRAAGLVVAAALLATVVGGGGAAQAVPTARSKAPTASANGICGTTVSASLAGAAARARAGDEPPPFDIATWLGEKAGGAIAGKAAGMAFDYLTKLPGLKEIVPKSEAAKTLEELATIENQLAAVSARLDLIGSQVDQAITELRTANLNTALDKACGYVNNAEIVYQHYYIPVVQAGITLGDILKSSHPEDAEVKIGDLAPDVQKLYTTSPTPCGGQGLQITCYTPKTLVDQRSLNFKQAVEDHNLIGAEVGASGQLSELLRPHDTTTSVLSAYGKYIMTKRYLTRTDSESLLRLYHDLAQGEAPASWMEAEYYTYYTVNETNEHVFKAYVTDHDAEQGGLPPMIPEGDVIDLEQKNADSTRDHPIWTLAGTQDTDYWPINVESNNDVTTTADGARNAVKAFNSQSCPAVGPCFTQWRIPSTADLKGLMSDTCKVDTTKNPPQVPPTCKPIVNGAVGGPNVAKFLNGLNPTNSTWIGVFCNRAVVTCATPPDQHNFIWTTDRRSHNTDCGYHVGFLGVHYPVYSRIYSLEAGLPLNFTNLNSTWPIYPVMPPQIPNYGAWDPTLAHTKCDQYTRTQIPLPTNRGIVFVTDSTSSVDFMAQPPKAAVQDATARQIAHDAAVDSERYARHNHGSFSGLNLHRLRSEVPEARSGEPAYVIAAHAINGGRGFKLTTRAEGTEDTFTITQLAFGGVMHTCTRVGGGAGRLGCQHLTAGHGRW
jgi:hypothetical protein